MNRGGISSIALVVLSAIAGCGKKVDAPLSFVSLGDGKESQLLWKEGKTYENIAYGNFAGRLELAKTTTAEGGQQIYEFHVLDSEPQKMPKGHIFKLTVPQRTAGVPIPGGAVANCELCVVSGRNTLLAPAYLVLRE